MKTDEENRGVVLKSDAKRDENLDANPPTSPIPSAATDTKWPFIALLTGALVIGCGPIFVRLSETAPTATAFWRLFLAQPFLWAIFAFEQRRTRRIEARQCGPRHWRDLRLMILVGLFFAGDLAVWHWSIKLTSVANATLLGNFAPVFVALFGWLLWREPLTRPILKGLAVALCGLILLMYGRITPSSTGGAFPVLGNALGLLTAAFYASYILTSKRVRAVFSAAALMAWSGLFCSGFLLVIALTQGGEFFPATMRGWLYLLGLALITHTLGQSLVTYAIAHLSATFSAIGLLLQTVVAAFLAWLVLGETIGAPQFVGGALVVSGILLARRES